jgi:hypothetical protein
MKYPLSNIVQSWLDTFDADAMGIKRDSSNFLPPPSLVFFHLGGIA